MSGSETNTITAVLLTEHAPATILEKLPEAVFPVRMKIALPHQRSEDSAHRTFAQPEYPVTVRTPETPYIPETTVYFDNPVERAPDGDKMWRPSDFADAMGEVRDNLDDTAGVDPDNLTLTELDVVEVPDRFLTTDGVTGDIVVKPRLYKKQAEMTVARFGKEGTLSASSVRERLEGALPGESRTPVQLIELMEVQAKQQRHGAETQSTGGRAQYYTETDAEKAGDLSLTPAVYRLEATGQPNDNARPLRVAYSELSSFLPQLMRGGDEVVASVTFVGQTQERTVFQAEDVR